MVLVLKASPPGPTGDPQALTATEPLQPDISQRVCGGIGARHRHSVYKGGEVQTLVPPEGCCCLSCSGCGAAGLGKRVVYIRGMRGLTLPSKPAERFEYSAPMIL